MLLIKLDKDDTFSLTKKSNRVATAYTDDRYVIKEGHLCSNPNNDTIEVNEYAFQGKEVSYFYVINMGLFSGIYIVLRKKVLFTLVQASRMLLV